MTDLPQFVEEMGLYFEGAGMQRMAGRIIGWLLVCTPPQQTMKQICEALQASKSSISTALWMLTQVNMISRVSLPGKRADYFKVNSDIWSSTLKARMYQLTKLRELAEVGLELLKDAPPDQRLRLEIMHDMNSFMEREFPKLIERWEEVRKNKGYDERS